MKGRELSSVYSQGNVAITHSISQRLGCGEKECVGGKEPRSLLGFSKAGLFLSLAVGCLQKLLTLLLSRGEMDTLLRDTSALPLFSKRTWRGVRY